MKTIVLAYLSGILTLGYVLTGTFFLKFWRDTRERLFGFFAASFFMLATQRILLTLRGEWGEQETWIYVLRLLAFLVLVFGIVEKNRSASTER